MDASARTGHVVTAQVAPAERVSTRVLCDLASDVRREWDDLVGRTGYADVSQLSGWARVRASAGYRPLYVLADCQGRLVGGAQILLRSVPIVGTIGYVPYGPVISDTAARAPVRRAVCAALYELGRRRTRVLLAQPPSGAEDVSAELLDMGFRESDAGIAPAASLRIGLDRGEEEIRSQLSRRLRCWSRRWGERGVRVRMGSACDIPTAAALFAQTAAHQGFAGFSVAYLRSLYDALAPGGHVVILLAEVGGTPVAAELLTCCGGVLKSRLAGLDRSDPLAPRLNVAAAVIWEAIGYARAHGYEWFDFGGVSSAARAQQLLSGELVDRSRLPGPDQFKLSFGGRIFHYPQAVELIHPAARLAYDLARRSRVGKIVLNRVKSLLRTGTSTVP